MADEGGKLRPVIVAGSAESGTLFRKVAGKTDSLICMAHGKDPQSKEQIQVIKICINQSAVKIDRDSENQKSRTFPG